MPFGLALKLSQGSVGLFELHQTTSSRCSSEDKTWLYQGCQSGEFSLPAPAACSEQSLIPARLQQPFQYSYLLQQAHHKALEQRKASKRRDVHLQAQKVKGIVARVFVRLIVHVTVEGNICNANSNRRANEGVRNFTRPDSWQADNQQLT